MGRMLQAKSGSAYIAPIVQTPPDVVDRMLALADVRERDVLYDLGSGDGNIILAAARTYGIKAAGRDPRAGHPCRACFTSGASDREAPDPPFRDTGTV